jgi:hypothetical protein
MVVLDRFSFWALIRISRGLVGVDVSERGPKTRDSYTQGLMGQFSSCVWPHQVEVGSGIPNHVQILRETQDRDSSGQESSFGGSLFFLYPYPYCVERKERQPLIFDI